MTGSRFLFLPILLLTGVIASAQGGSSGCKSSLSLQDCISMASDENVNVRNASLDYMSAKMLKKEAAAHYFPSASIVAGGFHALDPLVKIGASDILGSSDLANSINYYLQTTAPMVGLKTYYTTLENAYGAFVNVTQPVFAGGRIVNGNRLASLGVQAASLNESIAKRDAVTEVEKKYWLVVSLQEKMNVVQEGITLADSLYKDASSAFASGLVTQTDVSEVDLARQDLKAKRIRLKGGIMLARMDLCNAIGLDCSKARVIELTDTLGKAVGPQNYFRDPSSVVLSLQETQLLSLAVQQKQLEKKNARGEAMPEIAVGAMYGYGRFFGPKEQQNGMVYATIKIPLTDWSIAGSRIKNIDYQLQKASNQRDYLSSMLELQLRQLWVEVESTWEELLLQEEKVSQAKVLLEIASGNASAGLATLSELMEKQVELENAQCDLIDSRIAYFNAVAAFESRCRQ